MTAGRASTKDAANDYPAPPGHELFLIRFIDFPGTAMYRGLYFDTSHQER